MCDPHDEILLLLLPSPPGIYRFLNNPDCMTGYAGLHGLALMSWSSTIFYLALGCQLLNIVFLYSVEIPYMQKLYSRSGQKMRHKSPAIAKLQSKLEAHARKLQEQMFKNMHSIYQQISDTRDPVELSARDSLVATDPALSQAVTLVASETVTVGDSLTVKFTTNPNHAADDWIGIYEAKVRP